MTQRAQKCIDLQESH